MDLVEHLDRNGLSFEVHVEACDVLLGDLRKCFDLKSVGKGLLDGHLVLTRELHQEDVDDVEEDKDQRLEELDLVSDQEIGDDSQVDEDEDGFTCDNPPVDQGARVHNQVKHTYKHIQISLDHL